MSGKGYTLLERHRKDQRRGYVLLLSSLLYFLAILLDRSLLIPQWKYHQQSEASSNLIQQSQTTKDDKLTVTKLPPSESNKDSTECESLLHNDYKNSHTIIETNGSPHPHTVVFAPPTSQSIITKHLIKDGVWELSLYRKIKQKINPGMTFLDVGANMGLFFHLCSIHWGKRYRSRSHGVQCKLHCCISVLEFISGRKDESFTSFLSRNHSFIQLSCSSVSRRV
mmetsp:Transcript_24592/g.36445  ORF Transcript_24592/g.36445 Transcript_24592/m.36445 type:complete len:224 (+) Transcript_24592:64-735(+)